MDNLLFKTGNSGQVNVDQLQGIVECFVAGIGNKDSVGDVVVTGAFAKSLLRRKPRVVWGHSWNDPIGKVLEMYEVPVGDSRLPAKMRNAGIGGLYAKVQFNLQSEKGKEAFATVAFFGEDQEWSIGYKTIDSVFDQSLQANILKELELYEVSPVLHGANQLTGTISIKTDEKAHMPIIPMQVDGMPMMPTMNQAPRIVVVAAPTDQQDESSTDNPFAEGMSRELGQPEKDALQAELMDRTGSQIEVMNATENIVVFRRTTSDGKASMYRLPYHKEGSLYMFGKPEPYQAEAPQPQPMQNIQQKPGAPVVVPNGGIAYRNDDQQEMMNLFSGNVAMPFEKSDVSHLIELPEVYMAAAKDYLNPVLRHHKLAGRPSSKGIIIDGLLTANALDALQNAVKALGSTIGQASGNIGQAIGKIRDLAQSFNPYALDGDGDGFVQDGSAFQRPYIPIKKPGFDLPDVRGRKRSGDSLLDKPKAASKLPKDKNTWTRAQRNDALVSGLIEPETREDVAFLSNRRPDNEGIAKYWDMSEADLTKEGNRLANARRQATGAEKEKIDEELLKVSHDFQRRASYAETFGQDFVPPAKREMPNADLVPVDITENESIAQMLGAPKSKIPRTDEGFSSRYNKYVDRFDAVVEQMELDSSATWDEIDEDSRIEFIKELDYDYMYDVHGSLGDDGIVEAMESGKYDDEIAEFAEDAWNTIAEEKKLTADKERRQLDQDEAEDPRNIADAEEAARIEREELEEERRIERDRDRAADAAIDQALEQYIEEYGEDAPTPGFASTGDKPFTNTEVLMEVARRDGWRGGDRQPSRTSYDKANEALNDWNNLSEEERSNLLDDDEPTIEQFVDALLKARDTRLSKVRADRKLRTDAEKKRRADEVGRVKKFTRGDLSSVDTEGLYDGFNDEDEYGNRSRFSREYVNAVRENWKDMSQDDRDKAMRDYDTVVDDPDSVTETLRDAFEDYGYKNPKFQKIIEEMQSAADDDYEMSGLASRGEGKFGSNPEDSKAAKAFDAMLEKYWKMWGFDVPDEDEEGQDEPFGFASRGNNEEVKQEKLDELVEGVRTRLLAELETADPATWKPSWRNDSLPINVTTGKPYRGFNAFWLMLRASGEKYKTGRYAGYDQLKARGAQVRKGEKGVPILRPQLVKKVDADGNEKEFVRFRGTTVFNIDQADGGDDALRAVAADLPEEQRIAILDTTIAELGVDVRTENTTPHYSPTEDYISMPEFAKGTSPIEWSSTLAHETVHWTGGASRLNRPSVVNYGTDKKIRAYEELVAEIGSAMFLAAHGIEAPFRQDHAPYIKGWLQLLKDDPDALGRAFKDAQAAINHLLEKSPNLRKLFGGLDNGKKAPEIDAPDKAEALVGASDGFASLHRVRTPRSEALTGILYDDNSGDLMVGFQKGKPWDKLSQDERENWIGKAEESLRDRGGLPLTDDIDAVAKEMYDDLRDTGWYVYSDVSMNEVQELAAARSKGKHINALKKLKTARKATNEDSFNFFGRDERVQDVGRSMSPDGLASRGAAEPNEGLRRHKLMPAEVRAGMPDLYSTEDVPLEEKVLAAKFFSPYSNWTWYAVEFDGDDTFFGYVEGFENEWGNFSLSEIAGATLGGSLPAVERDRGFRPTKFGDLNKSDGFASSGSKRLGVEPRFTDSDWVDKTQQRILRSGLDFQSLSENDKIDWANSFLDEWLRENDMGYGLSDVANGRRINKRPDIELLNYAEDAFARMSDAHATRRSGFGEETQGLASVGSRTRRLGIQPSEAVDYVSYDPDSESLFVAYKREDGRGEMYVYEGVDMDDAIGVENARSVGRAINDIKRRKNVRKATPDEVVGLSDSESKEGKALKRAKTLNTIDAVYGDSRHGNKNRDVQLEINADRIDVDGGTATWTSSDDTAKYSISMDDDGGYTVTAEKLVPGDRETPDDWEELSSVQTDTREDAITALFEAANAKISGDIDEQKLDRELAEAKRELDRSGDAPGVISLDVTYSSALDAVDYNPSTQEMRVSFKDGGTYIYEGVDRETFDGFSDAPSKGRAMNDIKRAYPYRKDSEWAGGGDDDGGVEEFDVRGSEAVEKVSYDPETEDMLVVYAGGKGYVYTGVTRAEADAVRSAPSKGRAINDVKRTHEVRLLKGEDVRLFGGKKDSEREDGVATSDVDELRTFIDEQEGLLEVMELNGESAEKLAQQRDIVEKAKRDLSASGTTVVDPAPVAKPKMPTSKPPRGGKRVRNRNVVISMEQGDLDEIIAAESGKTTVDALRAAKGVGKYTKGPRKGKRRGPDTIAVRDAETGELLHYNEIELTSSSARGYVGRKQGQSPTGRKRGFIRARSYAGRQNHKITGDEGPNLRGEGKGMTEYDKRVYGLGSDEKNREFGLASRGEGSGLWGSNRSIDPDDPELSDSYIEDYVHDYVFEGGNFDFEDLVKYNRRKTVSDEELQKLYDDYLSDDNKISDEAADTIERTFFNEIVDDRYDAMLERYRSRFDYRDEDDGFGSRGSSLTDKPTPQEEKESFENYLDSEYGADFMDYTQMSDEEVKQEVMRNYRMSRSEANAFVKKLRKDEETYDDLWIAADDALDGEDGFASRSYDPSKNLAPERYVGYGVERYGSFDKETLLEDLESYRNRDQDEAERIADYWEQSDALWDEYFEAAISDADGDVLRAFSLAADRAYEDYLDQANYSMERERDGFASRGDAPTKTSLRRAATEKRAEIRSMYEDQGLFDPREPSERPAYNAMEKRIEDAQAELRDIERQIRNMPTRGSTEEGFASSYDDDETARRYKATEDKLNAPVVKGEKSPILGMDSLNFNTYRGGGSKFTPRSEQTYDINGRVSMPIYQPEATFNTRFADQIVKDFSRSDLTVEELADRFDLTPTQVQEVLDDAKENMLNLDGVRAGKYRADPYQIANLEKVEKIFVGDRKHTDIPEPTGEALAKKERRAEIQRAEAANDVAGKNYSDALKKLKYTDEYRQAETGYNKTTRENEQREYWINKDRLLQSAMEDLEGTDENNLSILTDALDGEDILEILTDSGVDFSNPTEDWYEDDYGTMRDGDGDMVGYEDLEWDSFDVDLESLSAEERQKLSDEVESTKNLIRTRAQDARKELGLSENPSRSEVQKAIRDKNTVAREPIAKLEKELSKKFPLVPVPDEQKRSSLYGIVDADGNKVDYRKLATEYEKIQAARRAKFDASRASGMTIAEASREDDGFASRMTEADRNDLRADTANYPDDYEADMANMASQDMANNFARLSKDDQNMYFQRALANNADSGMTTEQILDEARKLAMDDRQMAMLERQSVGMGGSSKPRKIDVSSSSALNSVSYDEINESLEVEYRGRDGKGTGTLYTYQGVTPDVVDRIEAADSRGATMREIRDNFEFTTGRKLPDSAYEGLASRGSINESSTGQRIVPSRMHSDDREALAEVNDPEERKQRIDELIEFYGSRIFAKPSSPKRKKIVQTQDENGYWVGPDGKPADFDFEDGFASRGGRKSTAEYRDLVDSLPNPTDRPSMNRYMQAADGARNVTEDRYALIHARRKIAKEMAEANGVEWKDGISIYDVTDDDDDLEILMDLDSRIDELNDYVTSNDKEYRRVRGLEQTVYKKSSELSEIKDSIDQSIEEYDFYKNDPDIFPGKPTPEELADDLRKAMKRHLRDLVDHEDYNDNRSLAREYSEDIAEAKTLIDNGTPEDLMKAAEILKGAADKQDSDYDDAAKRLDYEGDELLDSGYRPVDLRDEEFDYNSDGYDNWEYSDDIDAEDGKFNVIADELYGPEPTDADVVNEYMGVSDGLASRGNRRRPGRRNQGSRRQPMAPKTRYSDEDRQALADGNVLRSRTRPAKRRQGPSADEFDGFASTGTVDDVQDMATDPRGVFEGGEHGPGKDISLKKMWENIRRSGENNEWFSDSIRAEDFARELNIPRNVAQGLLDARPQSGGPELFIDDPYLADTLSNRMGITPARLFGFNPLEYFDNEGNPARDEDAIDAVIGSERARRSARVAAREGRRTGKADLYRGENTSVDVRELESKLNVKLTDENGDLLPAGAMERATRDTGLGWGLEKWRRISSRGGALTPQDIEGLIKRGILDQSRMPERGDLSFREVFQWPGFAGFSRNQIIDALSETLGLDRDEIKKQQRTIEEALSRARKGERELVSTRNLQASKLKISKAKIAEMVEKLGLDIDEFDSWFNSPSADKN